MHLPFWCHGGFFPDSGTVSNSVRLRFCMRGFSKIIKSLVAQSCACFAACNEAYWEQTCVFEVTLMDGGTRGATNSFKAKVAPNAHSLRSNKLNPEATMRLLQDPAHCAWGSQRYGHNSPGGSAWVAGIYLWPNGLPIWEV